MVEGDTADDDDDDDFLHVYIHRLARSAFCRRYCLRC